MAANGEVYYRSPGVFVEYYKNPESTAETKDAEGWVATGDAGFFEESTGHLRIIDRAKDVGKTVKRGHVCAQICREQAEILSQYPRGGGVWRRA